MAEEIGLLTHLGLIDKGTDVSDPNKWRQMGESLRGKGVGLAIPMVMVAGPIAGALIGDYLADLLEMPVILPLAIVLGIIAAFLETVNIIRGINSSEKG